MGKRHWIVCLFTSNHYSPRKRNSVDSILDNTRSAVTDLKTQLGECRQYKHDKHPATGKGKEEKQDDKDDKEYDVDEGDENDQPGPLYSCRINAGLFDVPWKQTKSILVESGLKMTIVRPPGESDGEDDQDEQEENRGD